MDKEILYDLIDEDETLSDDEKREAYFAEIENDKMEREWEESQFP